MSDDSLPPTDDSALKVKVTTSVSLPTVIGQSKRACAPPSRAKSTSVWSASRVAPSTVIVSLPSLVVSSPAFTTTAPIWARSPAVKKRGSSGRTWSSLVATTSLTVSPTRVSAVIALAASRQVVRLSGKATLKVISPFSSLTKSARQKAMSGKSSRTSSSPGPPSPPPPPLAPSLSCWLMRSRLILSDAPVLTPNGR